MAPRIRGKQLNASWDHADLLRLLGVPIFRQALSCVCAETRLIPC